MSRTPTIVLVAHHGAAARYLLRTDVLPAMLDGGARVVILAPNADEPYMQEEFGGDERIVLERLRELPPPAGRFGWIARFVLLRLRRNGVGAGHRSRAFKNKYDGFRAKQRGMSKVAATLMHPVIVAQWRSKALRKLVLALETRLTTPEVHADVFERHAPDLVVAASPGIFPADAQVLREARRRGVRTAAIVLGWDNPTSKGYRGADVDEVVVWSERMAEQMAEFHDVPRERLFVGGVPFWDFYHREGGLPSREEVFARQGLDPSRRMVVFCTSAPGLWEMNEPIAETIAGAIDAGALGDAQLVVRVHPNFRLPNNKRGWEGFQALAARYPFVRVDVPEVRSETLRIDRAADDGWWLGGLFRHCDVLVNVFSTTALEGFILDRPVVLIAEEVGLGGSAGRGWGEFEHLRALGRYGAGRVAHQLGEIPGLIAECLEDPDADREARRRVAVEECGPLDGRSGERVGRRLLELAGVAAPEREALRA